MQNAGAKPLLVSIGALSKASGVPVATLRTWERRYGFPVPVRLPSGHRRYNVETIEHVQLIRRALEAGHRASDVVGIEAAELSELVDDEQGPESMPARGASALEAWLDCAVRFDGAGLDHGFRRAWQLAGARNFVRDLAVPFLQRMGQAWMDDELSVAQEHFASAKLHEFLAQQWRPISETSNGPLVVCASPETELHGLALDLAAILIGLSGAQVLMIGANTPVVDIAEAVASTHAAGVVASISPAADVPHAVAQIAELRRLIAPTVAIVVGGGGAADAGDLEGVEFLPDFDSLESWVAELAKLGGRSRDRRF